MTSLMLTQSDPTQQTSTTQHGASVESSQPAQVMPMSAEVAPAKKTTNFVGHIGVKLAPCVCSTQGDGCLGSVGSCILLPFVCLTGVALVRF
jgi:hypothetical protein